MKIIRGTFDWDKLLIYVVACNDGEEESIVAQLRAADPNGDIDIEVGTTDTVAGAIGEIEAFLKDE